MANIRPKDLPAVTSPTAGDKLIIDGATARSITQENLFASKKLSDHAATTSAELKTVISDETGSGALVFATSPTLVTPALGTPASGVLTNCTGLPLSGHVNQAAYTIVGNFTGGAAPPTASTIPALTHKTTPVSADKLMLADSAASDALKYATIAEVVGALASGVSSIAGNTGAFTLSQGIINSTNDIRVDPTFFPTFIGGLALSNNAGTPNSVLDIAAGSATDSTNAVMMKAAAFTKSTAGAWASGSGSNGMGNGLTIANNTWYHVLMAYNGGTTDYWFDTSATGANKPAGITGTQYRRIGSFKTNASAQILGFKQRYRSFYWDTPVTDQSFTAITASTPTSLTLASIPSGVRVRPIIALVVANGSGNTARMRIYSPDLPDNNLNNNITVGVVGTGLTTSSAYGEHMNSYSNTSQQLRVWTVDSNQTLNIITNGWVDDLGQ